jgi:hypothetical protein
MVSRAIEVYKYVAINIKASRANIILRDGPFNTHSIYSQLWHC